MVRTPYFGWDFGAYIFCRRSLDHFLFLRDSFWRDIFVLWHKFPVVVFLSRTFVLFFSSVPVVLNIDNPLNSGHRQFWKYGLFLLVPWSVWSGNPTLSWKTVMPPDDEVISTWAFVLCGNPDSSTAWSSRFSTSSWIKVNFLLYLPLWGSPVSIDSTL
jgi:hypothetical protein